MQFPHWDDKVDLILSYLIYSILSDLIICHFDKWTVTKALNSPYSCLFNILLSFTVLRAKDHLSTPTSHDSSHLSPSTPRHERGVNGKSICRVLDELLCQPGTSHSNYCAMCGFPTDVPVGHLTLFQKPV